MIHSKGQLELMSSIEEEEVHEYSANHFRKLNVESLAGKVIQVSQETRRPEQEKLKLYSQKQMGEQLGLELILLMVACTPD